VSRTLRYAVVAVLLLGVAVPGPARSEAPRTIAVVLSRDLPAYREALRGFEEVLSESHLTYRLLEFAADPGEVEPATLAGRIRAKRPDLVLSIGSAATSQIARQITDVPVVFSMVLSSAGTLPLQELRETHPNLTGATMEIPVRVQFAKLKEILPTARRIGVLYDPALNAALVEQATQAARALDLELVPQVVTSEAELFSRVGTLAGRVDVLWSVADSTVFSDQGLKYILLETLRHGIPFVGLSPAFVKAGALLAFSTDYRDLGRQAGEQGVRILAGEEAAAIPLGVPRGLSLSINLNTAKQIRVEIPEAIRRQAAVTF
jgi:putative tryptophan/tyrosine transport system substrate-binding protein